MKNNKTYTITENQLNELFNKIDKKITEHIDGKIYVYSSNICQSVRNTISFYLNKIEGLNNEKI